jgi:hypothetical protein
VGTKRWLEKRGGGPVPEKRPGVTINRRDLIAVPVPAANMLWRDLHVREGSRAGGKTRTQNVLIEITVEGMDKGETWACGLEFDYANEESFYCRPLRTPDGQRIEVPSHLAELRLAYLPPMSGLSPREDRLEIGTINVRLGEGRTAEVLRNLCWQVLQSENGKEKWKAIVERIEKLFGAKLLDPYYIKERGEIVMNYHTREGIKLDLSASGRGQQQTLLLLAHMAVNPGAVLLLDEPDAHLEILRQRQIYRVLSDQAKSTGSQIIAVSHSEVILDEAADRNLIIAFVGKPHRIDNHINEVRKSLREIPFENYYLAEVTGWVLYLEGPTDFTMLRAFAKTLNHPALQYLDQAFVYYVGNQPNKAQRHFYGLREAKSDLVGIAIYDQMNKGLPEEEADSPLTQRMWQRRELENYLCQPETLLAYAEYLGREPGGEQHKKKEQNQTQGNIFSSHYRQVMSSHYRQVMQETINQIESTMRDQGKDPWSAKIKASEEFLGPLFKQFFERLRLKNGMRKTDYHKLADFVPKEKIDPEIEKILNKIVDVASKAKPGIAK